MPDGSAPIWRDDRKPQRRREAAVLVVAALIALAVLLHGLNARRYAAAHSPAQVIATGYAKAQAANDTDPEDDALPAAERDAGYMWARNHRIERATQCAAYSPTFRRGCGDYVDGVAP